MDLRRPYDVSGNWESRGACRSAEADLFFASGVTQEYRAKAVCRLCSVRWDCLAYALAYRVEHGVWGGLTDRERRKILNRLRPPAWNRDEAMRAVS